MNFAKASDDDKLALCKRYFYVGCAMLPFVWLVNAFWFYKEAFKRPSYPHQKQIQKYVLGSAIGVCVWTIIFVTWQIVFHTQRYYWGATGDYMSFVYPRGYA